MAYMRANDPETGKYRLLSSNLDGSDEKVLQIAPLPVPGQSLLVARRKTNRLYFLFPEQRSGTDQYFRYCERQRHPAHVVRGQGFHRPGVDSRWAGTSGELSLVGINQPANRLRFLSRRPVPIAYERHARLSNAKPFWRRQGDGLDSAARNGFSLLAARDG